jgi:hypothetical protein
MVIIFIKCLSFSRLKKKVSSNHFKNHTGKWPHICRWTIVNTNNSLRRSVLSCLNLTWKMMMIPTTISQITNLDLNVFIYFWSTFQFLLRLFCRCLLDYLCNLRNFNFLLLLFLLILSFSLLPLLSFLIICFY